MKPLTPARPPANPLAPSANLLAALGVLRRAQEMAVQMKLDPWEFAVRLPVLVTAGLSETDVRSLVAQRLVQHAQEQIRPTAGRRSFRRMANLAITDQTCFVLTPAGERLLESSTGQTATELTPSWDGDRRQLWYSGQLVKWFRKAAECQELILTAFQEEGWVPRIDDPLPRIPERDPKERLHDSVRRLNEAQKTPLLFFERDGTGQGVTWAAMVAVSGTIDDDWPRPTAIIAGCRM